MPALPHAPSKSSTGRPSPGWQRAASSTRTTPIASATRRRKRSSKHKKRDLDALGDWLLAYYRKLIAAARDERQGPCGRAALPVANRFRLPLDGRLAGQSTGHAEGAQPARGDTGKGSQPGGDHGRSLRYRLHGGPLLQGEGREAGARWPRPAPTTITPPRRRSCWRRLSF